MNYFSNYTLSMLSRNLDGLWLRQQVTMENLANSSTPNYKSKYVDFEHALKRKMDSLSYKAESTGSVKASELNTIFSEGEVVLAENTNKTMRLDGNNVDVETESVDLAKTQINYSYSVAELSSYFTKMKLAISGLK